MQLSPEIVTFGCRLNAYESEVMRAHAMASGEDGLVVVNTCAVTGEAVRQARQQIRRLKRERPASRIIVTGCAAQTEPQTFAAMPEVARVLGNAEKLQAESFRFDDGADAPAVRVNDIMSVTETAGHLIDGYAERARAFVEVQNGCDHRCTFCIIPYGRGNSRSVPADLVVERIRRLVGDEGYNEVVLTGVDVTSYGADLPGTPTLGTLVQRILAEVPALPRLRLSSIDSVEIDAPLFDAITGDARLMPHLHLSLQAGDDMILKRMKRRHSRDDALRFCAEVRARRPEVTFGADLIAGFPTETDAMFENTLAMIDACDIVYGHIFPYSARTGTPAAKMPQVPVPLRKERASRLRRAAAARLDLYLRGQVGRTQEVLVDSIDGRGHSAAFAPVRVAGAVRGQIVRATVTHLNDGMLEAA
ncbi:tRNA (N(6)-L-threonylcarbamoyladenosine(37)-C(2))-methylthiotransferase MtaB [Sphingoaurantiacus capsulatus]|uniref:tRNA (N(6)-L-threonylcarbamoyladenosine(37)-C(2))-methylthiotransferase n=1 Tax=Sphingoaurantiacus capsulatus TaxID=1771310 RepID=A0ABV7X9X2_9SPHN